MQSACEEINNLLPPEQKRHILPGDFTIPPVGLRFRRLPSVTSLPPAVETPEVMAAERRLRRLFTSAHTEADKLLLRYERSHEV